MYNIPIYQDSKPIEIKKLIFYAKKLLPDMVFNMSALEGNPFTFPEVQTLLDGVTIGGHKLSDHEQILRLKDSWEYIFSLLKSQNQPINKKIFDTINFKVADGEALEAGVFRTGNVGISGTNYQPPKPEELNSLFEKGINELYQEYSKSSISMAIAIFLWGAKNQFYWDGNKRTSRLVANLILISNGQGIMNIKNKDKLEFNKLMIDFYNTSNGKIISEFLYDSIEKF